MGGAVAVAIVLSLAACGGGGGDDADAPPESVDVSIGAQGGATTSAAPAGPTATATSDTFITDDIPLPVSDQCAELAVTVTDAFAGLSVASDPQTFAQFAEAFARLREVVPTELQADVDVMSAAYARIDAVLAEYDYDITSVYQDPSAAEAFAAAFDDADGDVTESAERLDSWFSEQCPDAAG